MKLFSVIIPTYKGEDSLPVALESICAQTYKNIEVIVSDDNGLGTASQLSTKKVCDGFRDRLNIIYLANEHVNGSHARNEGLKRAKGEYISLLDDDDFYLKDYAEKAVETFGKGADMVFFNVAILTKEGVSRIVRNDEINAVDLLFYHKEIGTGSNLCFKRKIYDEDGGFDERYLRSQDIEFAVKKLHRYSSEWIDSLQIVKFYNRTDNFPDYRKSLEVYSLLREDMSGKGIIDKDTCEKLYIRQLHCLYNDLLVKKAPVKDIRAVYDLLDEKKNLSFMDRSMYQVYRISKGLFRFVFDTYMSIKNKNEKNEAAGLLQYRKELEDKYR